MINYDVAGYGVSTPKKEETNYEFDRASPSSYDTTSANFFERGEDQPFSYLKENPLMPYSVNIGGRPYMLVPADDDSIRSYVKIAQGLAYISSLMQDDGVLSIKVGGLENAINGAEAPKGD